jgi:hypothetical protein
VRAVVRTAQRQRLLPSSKGQFGFGAQWTGQGAPLSRPMTTAQLLATLATELEQTLSLKERT